MGVRYQKRITLGKFVTLNVSKSGVGASLGITGLRVSTGPSGTQFSVGIPGTGLSYRHHVGPGKWFSWANVFNWGGGDETPSSAVAAEAPPPLPEPGFFASAEEKAISKGVKALQADKLEEALSHFMEAAPKDAGAAIMAAKIMSTQTPSQKRRAIPLLEQVVFSDAPFPTDLMQKYLSTMQIDVDITPTISVSVPIAGFSAVLLLVELYQLQRRIGEAIALLEELESLNPEPVLTLSLCDLYLEEKLWDGVIERTNQVESEDDVSLGLMIMYALALHRKGLPDAAISVYSKALRRTKDRSPELLKEGKYWRAISYDAAGKQSRAREEWQKLYAEDPTYRDVATKLGV